MARSFHPLNEIPSFRRGGGACGSAFNVQQLFQDFSSVVLVFVSSCVAGLHFLFHFQYGTGLKCWAITDSETSYNNSILNSNKKKKINK